MMKSTLILAFIGVLIGAAGAGVADEQGLPHFTISIAPGGYINAGTEKIDFCSDDGSIDLTANDDEPYMYGLFDDPLPSINGVTVRCPFSKAGIYVH